MLTRTFTRPFKFMMNGLASLKDLRTGTALTMTGTPTTASLLGATAPVIAAGAYTTCKIPTATIGLTAGQPFTIMCVVQTTWAGNDALVHYLFSAAVADTGSNRLFIRKDNANNLLALATDSAGVSYYKSIAVNATNWAANVPHIIIMTRAADGTINAYLDGVPFRTTTGTPRKESALNANVCIGNGISGTTPLTGSILCAVWNAVLSDFWTDTGGALYNSMVNGLAYDSVNNLLYAATESSLLWRYNGTTWTQIGNDLAGFIIYSLAYDSVHNILYAGTIAHGVWKCANPDAVTPTWTNTGGSIAGFQIGALVYDSTHDILYAGCFRPYAGTGSGVWKYDGATWTDTGGGLAGDYIYAMTYDSTHNILYAGSSMNATGVWSYDGSTWTDTGGGLSGYGIESLVYDSANNLVYAGTYAHGVWEYDGTWTDTGGGLSGDYVAALVYDSANGILYAGTWSYGVWSYDGSTWTGTGMGTILALACDEANNILYAGTTGVWKYLTPASIPPLWNLAAWHTLIDIIITGLLTGNTATLSDPSGTLIDSAAESGGQAVLDASTCTFNTNPYASVGGFKGKLEVFDGAKRIVSLPTNDLWGGDVYAWADDANLITIHKAETKSAYVSILDPKGSTALARLTEHFPVTGWTPDIFENLSFESVNRGGYTVASFTIHRPVTQYWADLQYRNQVTIGRGSEIYWEGYISKPVRSIRPDVIEVNCLGWSAELNQLWTASDITAPVGGYKMSTFINTVLLADPNTSLVAGMIETGDYAYPEGTVFALARKYYFDALEELDAGNNFNWGVWGNRAIDLRAKHSSVDWLVWTGDCEDLTISPNPDALANYVNVHFTQDGTHYEDAAVFDAPSSLLYGWRMVNIDIPGKVDESFIAVGPPPLPGGATHIAEVYLAEHKDLKVAAEFTCNRIFDSYGAEQYLGKVRGGEVVRIVDWLPTEETLGGVNDIATFEIKSPKYDHDNDTLAITPTEFLPSTDIQIARLQATGY